MPTIITPFDSTGSMRPTSSQKDQQCGLHCLSTNLSDWDETRLRETYLMLTEIEATFRSLKTELGLRPVYHQKKARVNAHLFISLLAYHLVHTLRHQLKEKGIHLSWESIRDIMATQQRVTLMLPTDANTGCIRNQDNQRVFKNGVIKHTQKLGIKKG